MSLSAGDAAATQLPFDRMSSQILVRNMMNNDQADKLETRKQYLSERGNELDSLHAKMKALNDRINLIKQQNAQPTNSTNQPMPQNINSLKLSPSSQSPNT